jgi:hypothetical protein
MHLRTVRAAAALLLVLAATEAGLAAPVAPAPGPAKGEKEPAPDAAGIAAAEAAEKARAAGGVPLRVLEATYSGRGTKVDVARKVMQLIGQRRSIFVGVDLTDGVDPVPNVQKTLLVLYEMGENTYMVQGVDGRTIVVPSPDARKIGPLRAEVMSAKYGAPGKEVDVTEKVKGRVRTNGTAFVLVSSNSLERLTGDSKDFMLTVQYRYRGKEVTVAAPEHAPLYIPAIDQKDEAARDELRKKQPNGLLIVRAMWTDNGVRDDVTNILRTAVVSDSLTVVAVPESFQQHYTNGRGLYVVYDDGKGLKWAGAAEHDTLQIGSARTSFMASDGPRPLQASIDAVQKAHPQDRLLVLEGRVGKNNSYKDVTAVCQAMVAGKSLTVPNLDQSYPEGPDVGGPLKVTIWDVDTEKLSTYEAPENATLQIGAELTSYRRGVKGLTRVDEGLAAARKAGGDGLLILAANWGYRERTVDVSEKLQKLVTANHLRLRLQREVLGEPTRGGRVELALAYWDGQKVQVVTLADNKELDIRAEVAGLAGLHHLPTFVAAGKPLSQELALAGAYRLVEGPAGLAITPQGRVTWNPTDGQTGPQTVRYQVTAGGKVMTQVDVMRVVPADLASQAPAGKDLASFMRMDLAGTEYQFVASPDGNHGLLLQKDELVVTGGDGLTVTRRLKLEHPYVRIAERPGAYVAVRLDPMVMDLLNKDSGKVVKSIKLQYPALTDMALMPDRNVSLLCVANASTIPHYRIVVVDETTGVVREPKDLAGTFVAVDPSGRHVYAVVSDIYQDGMDFHINPDWQIIDTPTFGNIDFLLRYDVVGNDLVLKAHRLEVGTRAYRVSVSPDGRRVSVGSYSGYPRSQDNERNTPAWSVSDFEEKPLVYQLLRKNAERPVELPSYHPVLPWVALPHTVGVCLFDRDTTDEIDGKVTVDPETFKGAKILHAFFAPDGQSIVAMATLSDHAFLARVALKLSAAERASIKTGLATRKNVIPDRNRSDDPAPPGAKRI